MEETKTTTNKKSEWLDQLENEIIPWVATLIDKEKAHNEFLRNSKVELEFKRGTWHFPWVPEIELNISEINDMIRYSNTMLKHFETRHGEYIEFVKQERAKIK